LCGKTTNLVWIHDHFEGGERGKMISLATEGDRTIFFDLLPLEIGSIRGMDVTLQLYTVPGQVHYNSTRQLVLRGADGVVFVADSQRAMQSSNTDSFKNLQENLLLQGISLDGFPHVLQFNKRDLKDLTPAEELNDELNHYSVPIFEAVATEGVGVQETLEGIVKLVMRNLRQRYEGATTGARTPGIDDSQVDVSEPPPTPPPVEPVVPPDEPPAPVTFDPEPAPVEEAVEAPEPAPPVEPIAPREEPPTEIEYEPEELTAEEPSPVEEPPEEPPPSSIPEPIPVGDPAETVDFSKAGGGDPFGGLGGGFEDEVSTAVYDVNDDSAIDFEELKALDAQKAPPPPPPVVETSQVDAPDHEIGRPVVDTFDSAEPEAATPSFDLESTDAGVKTQDAAERDPTDSLAAFDPDAPAPDMDSIPDFELDEPEPEPEAPKVEEAAPPVVEFEAPAEAVPEAAAEPAVVEEFPPVAAEAPPVEGRYEDRIDAPSPFAPNPEAPGGSPEVLEALGVPPVEVVAEATPVEPEPEVPAPEFVEQTFEPPPVEVVEEVADIDEPSPVEVVEEVAEIDEPPPVEEVEVAIEVSAEAAESEQLFDATPAEPIVVGNADPWTEEELSGVYDLAEVEKAEQAAAIEAAESRPVEVSAEDNQLHLRLQGTGAIVESGQVRALDIEVPVPGSWVGNRRVTLQLRLTLTPDTEDADDGSDSPS
jgi:signal recognition particle receptor subunit beta